jgi:hypothetical protein
MGLDAFTWDAGLIEPQKEICSGAREKDEKPGERKRRVGRRDVRFLMDELIWVPSDLKGALPWMFCFVYKPIPTTFAQNEGHLFIDLPFQLLRI